jgi:hypothetical protein
MGWFSSRQSGSSNGRSTRNSSAHGHKPASAGKRQQQRAEAWGRVADQKRRQYGRKSPEYREAAQHERDEWRKVPEWRAWAPWS